MAPSFYLLPFEYVGSDRLTCPTLLASSRTFMCSSIVPIMLQESSRSLFFYLSSSDNSAKSSGLRTLFEFSSTIQFTNHVSFFFAQPRVLSYFFRTLANSTTYGSKCLRSVEIDQPGFDVLSLLKEHFVSLESVTFHLDAEQFRSEKGSLAIVDLLPLHLHTLCLYLVRDGHHIFTDATVEAIARKFGDKKLLRALVIDSVRPLGLITDRSMSVLAAECSSLVTLSLTFCAIGNDGLRSLAEGLPFLKHLSLNDCALITSFSSPNELNDNTKPILECIAANLTSFSFKHNRWTSSSLKQAAGKNSNRSLTQLQHQSLVTFNNGNEHQLIGDFSVMFSLARVFHLMSSTLLVLNLEGHTGISDYVMECMCLFLERLQEMNLKDTQGYSIVHSLASECRLYGKKVRISRDAQYQICEVVEGSPELPVAFQNTLRKLHLPFFFRAESSIRFFPCLEYADHGGSIWIRK